MISRETAEAIVTTLEAALDHLRRAHALSQSAADGLLATTVEPAWIATANTGGMLSVIYDAYPDLAGEDAPGAAERDASIETLALNADADDQVCGLLEDARDLLSRVAQTIEASDAASAKTRFDARCRESISALISTIQSLR